MHPLLYHAAGNHGPGGVEKTLCHPQNRKYITCRNLAGGGPSHSHRQKCTKIGKDRACGSGDILAERQRDTQTHTNVLIAILCTPYVGEVNITLSAGRGQRNKVTMPTYTGDNTPSTYAPLTVTTVSKVIVFQQFVHHCVTVSQLTLLQVLVIATFPVGSQQVELGFLIRRQTCPSVRTHLDTLYDCQPGKLS